MEKQAAEQLLKQLTAALERDPWVDTHQWPIEIEPTDAHLILQGRVENVAAKRSAVVHARLLSSLPVEDRLRVAVGEARQDKELRNEVVKILGGEPALSECRLRVMTDTGPEIIHEADRGHIDIDVDDGVVTLSGEVGSLSHLRLAEVLAWWSPGCQAVVNHLRVEPPQEDSDDEIADAVGMALEKDPLVHASQVVIDVRGGAVTLQGSVATEEEKHFAALDAWMVPGVRKVDNRIETRS